jgi:tyrosyl-tRNA synthetase
LETFLRNGGKLRIYQGFDPTGTQLHIGHAVALRKLREFQDLGHHIIFLIGDGTGQAGDPSGKKKTRETFFTREELKKNAKDYVMQASKIVRFDGEHAAEILYNGEWLNTLKLADILKIAENFTVQQFLERDMYQERMKVGEGINLREFLYPLLQGYDSVAMNVNMEIGGTDQTFNMLVGRTLVQRMLHNEKYVLTVPLLTDSKGVKIGKSEENVIGITDPPEVLYAKIMTLGDDSITNCFTLLTNTPLEDIADMKRKMESGENPMTYKKKLAYDLTAYFHSEEKAANAQVAFEQIVQKGEIPNDIPQFTAERRSWVVLDLLIQSKLVVSRSEARRLIEQKAVEINGNVLEPGTHEITLNDQDIVRVGKRKYTKILFQGE